MWSFKSDHVSRCPGVALALETRSNQFTLAARPYRIRFLTTSANSSHITLPPSQSLHLIYADPFVHGIKSSSGQPQGLCTPCSLCLHFSSLLSVYSWVWSQCKSRFSGRPSLAIHPKVALQAHFSFSILLLA